MVSYDISGPWMLRVTLLRCRVRPGLSGQRNGAADAHADAGAGLLSGP